MPGLSNIFGGDDSDSSNDSNASGSIIGDAGSAVGLDVASDQNSFNQNEDGNTSSTSNSNDVGLNTDTDGLLGAVGHVMDSADESQS